LSAGSIGIAATTTGVGGFGVDAAEGLAATDDGGALTASVEPTLPELAVDFGADAAGVPEQAETTRAKAARTARAAAPT
jgi:Zn-dependent alcohol dehydrogenase